MFSENIVPDSKPSGDWGQVIIAEVNVGQSDQYL